MSKSIRNEINELNESTIAFNKLTYKTGRDLSNIKSLKQLMPHLENYQKELNQFIELIETKKPFK
jgi:hypothetical protein